MINDVKHKDKETGKKLWEIFDKTKVLLSELNEDGYKRKVQEVVDNIFLKLKDNSNYEVKFGDYQPSGICDMFGLPEGLGAAKGRSKFLKDVDKGLSMKEQMAQ